MALERVPADIRVEGGVARMSDPSMIKEIMEAVTIPVMAKARIGHFVECQVRKNYLYAGEMEGGNGDLPVAGEANKSHNITNNNRPTDP